MEKLIIRGAEIRHLNMPVPKEGSPFVRVHLRADLTEAIQEAMGWEDIPMCVASAAKLPGELNCTSVEILPNGDNLKIYERCLQITAAEDFKAVPVKDDDGDIVDHALELTLKIAEYDSMLAAITLANAIGRATCKLSVSYEQPAQGKLELSHEAGVDDGDADQPELEPAGEDGELYDTVETFLGSVEEPAEDAGPLPSAVSMAGSTEKLRKQRRARTPKPISDPGAVDWDQEQALDPNVPHTFDSSVEVM